VKNEEATTPPDKSYDIIEDAIDSSKKNPNKTWDDLTRKPSGTERQGDDQKETGGNERVAASVQWRKPYRVT